MRLTTKILFFLLTPFICYSHIIKILPGQSISQIVLNAHKHDTLLLSKGYYKEFDIIINKPLSIIGENHPTIDAQYKGHIFIVQSDSVNIRNLYLINTSLNYIKEIAAIRIDRSNNCMISDNIIFNSFFGIYLAKSENCTIKNNQITGIIKKESNSGNAIHMWYCKNIIIMNNITEKHRDGIYLEFTTDSKIHNNISRLNIRYGLHFMFSHHCSYLFNKFIQNNAGVAVMYSEKITMKKNIFKDNWSFVSNGLLLKDIKNSDIEENEFISNTTGIYMEGCLRNIIRHNLLEKNGWAMKILGTCENNQVTENNFIDNIFEVTTNASVSSNLFQKNYWSHYSGYDLNKDNIGDIPYRPVSLFTYIIQNSPYAVILLKSLFVDILELSEKIYPDITPSDLKDNEPSIIINTW